MSFPAAISTVVRPITERMAEAKAELIARGRVPRCFYLSADDYAAFAATDPPSVEAMFAVPLGSKPSLMTCLGFEGIAVRPSKRKVSPGNMVSNLICRVGTTIRVQRPVDLRRRKRAAR